MYALYHLATDDDPRDHPFSFPRLIQLDALGDALADALERRNARRPDAAALRGHLETLLDPPAPPVRTSSGIGCALSLLALVEVTDADNTGAWRQVRAGDTVGWVSARYLRITG
ncbi:MAG: hypothetical protein RLZZ387_316 [Chloroflexota bacterium]